MAVTQVGNRVYARITDLSEESVFNNGDKLIFHCASTGNASLIDWSNVKIDLDHCTFGATFNGILEFSQTASAWVNTMTDSFAEVEAKCNDAIELTNQMTNEIAAIKMLIKMILGIASAPTEGEDRVNYKPEDYVSTLTEDAKAIYQSLIDEVVAQCGNNIEFQYWNLNYLTNSF